MGGVRERGKMEARGGGGGGGERERERERERHRKNKIEKCYLLCLVFSFLHSKIVDVSGSKKDLNQSFRNCVIGGCLR